MSQFDSFIAGFFYGATTVIVGQPLDTVKTRMQATVDSVSTKPKNTLEVFKYIFNKEGIKGLYRGGATIAVGGALIRSAQFGVYNNVLAKIHEIRGETKKEDRLLGIFDPNVAAAGFAGGLGRGLVEGPFEYIKVRRQVDTPWKINEIFSGSGATIFRNSFLFSSFAIYMDLSRQIFEGGMSPFMTGAICANMAWLTIWPLDVAKSQLQSGNYTGKSFAYLVKDTFVKGIIFRGLMPGLIRSTIANGCSMVVYKFVEKTLKEYREGK